MDSKEKLSTLFTEKTSLLKDEKLLYRSVTRILVSHYKLSSLGELRQLLFFKNPMELGFPVLPLTISYYVLNERAKKERKLEKSYYKARGKSFLFKHQSVTELSICIIPFLEEINLYPSMVSSLSLLKLIPKKLFADETKFRSHELNEEMGYYLIAIRESIAARFEELCSRYCWLESELALYEKDQEKHVLAIKAKLMGNI